MSISFLRKAGILATTAALSLTMLAGCATSSMNTAASPQDLNRQYMQQVNGVMDSLSTEMTDFSDAVARKDLVTMKTKVDGLSKEIEQLEGLTVPEGLQDLQDHYVAGVTDMKTALTEYVNLYAEVQNGQKDPVVLEEALKKVQASYDTAIKELKTADENAVNKE